MVWHKASQWTSSLVDGEKPTRKMAKGPEVLEPRQWRWATRSNGEVQGQAAFRHARWTHRQTDRSSDRWIRQDATGENRHWGDAIWKTRPRPKIKANWNGQVEPDERVDTAGARCEGSRQRAVEPIADNQTPRFMQGCRRPASFSTLACPLREAKSSDRPSRC